MPVNCVAYSLFSFLQPDNTYHLNVKYVAGFIDCHNSIKLHLPGWRMVVYHDDTLEQSNTGRAILNLVDCQFNDIVLYPFDMGAATPRVKAGARLDIMRRRNQYRVVAFRDILTPVALSDAESLLNFANDKAPIMRRVADVTAAYNDQMNKRMAVNLRYLPIITMSYSKYVNQTTNPNEEQYLNEIVRRGLIDEVIVDSAAARVRDRMADLLVHRRQYAANMDTSAQCGECTGAIVPFHLEPYTL